MTRVTELLAELDRYRPARQRMLSALGLAESNREPLAEFAEHFVAALTEEARLQPRPDAVGR